MADVANYFDKYDDTPLKMAPTDRGGATNHFDQYDTPANVRTTEPAPKATSEPQTRDSIIDRFFTGMNTGLIGAGQLAAHIVPLNNLLHAAGLPVMSNAEWDQKIAERAQKLRKESGGKLDIPQLLGEAAAPTNYIGGPLADAMKATPLAEAILGGTVGGIMQPSEHPGKFLAEKGKQGLIGMAGGGALHEAGKVVGQIAKPTLRKSAQDLAEAGVRLTPGQMLGGIPRRAEEAAKSLPILGSAIRSGEKLATSDFNRSLYDAVLAPIGETYQGKEVGNEGIKAVRERLSAAYDRVLSQAKFQVDPHLVGDLRILRQAANELPPAQRSQFVAIINNRLGGRIGPSGQMTGDTFKQVEGEISNFAAQYHSSPDAAQRQLADLLDEANGVLRNGLERSNPPGVREALAKVNAGWARFTRIRKAATARPKSDGIFTPGDLLGAIKSSDRTAGKRAFSEGDALLQSQARGGNEVLTNKLGDTYSVERMAWDLGAGGLLGGHISPEIPISLLGGSSIYTRPGLTMLNKAITAAPVTRGIIANSLRRGSDKLAPGAGADTVEEAR